MVCCVARLEPRKNQHRLIQATARLRRRGLSVRLLLVGEDVSSYQRELLALVEQERCTDIVTFLGFQDPRAVYWASDINALVSLEEGFGLVVIEAATTGLPPLRSRSAGPNDQVNHGQTGLLVDAENVAAIAAELDKLATNESYRKQLGRSANAAARTKYSLCAMAEQVEHIYQETADEYHRVPSTRSTCNANVAGNSV